MNLTQEQISEILQGIAEETDSYRQLLKQSLEAIMRAERHEFNQKNDDSSNGYRPRKIRVQNEKVKLLIPRSRQNNFYPMILASIKEGNEGSEDLAFELYRNEPATEHASRLFEKIYVSQYPKPAISQMIKRAKSDVTKWLNRSGLDTVYPVIHINAAFWQKRFQKIAPDETYYTILGVKQDGKVEVLSIVSQLKEGVSNWGKIFDDLKSRGVQNVQLVVSDGLSGIEDEIKKSFPEATVQLCAVR